MGITCLNARGEVILLTTARSHSGSPFKRRRGSPRPLIKSLFPQLGPWLGYSAVAHQPRNPLLSSAKLTGLTPGTSWHHYVCSL